MKGIKLNLGNDFRKMKKLLAAILLAVFCVSVIGESTVQASEKGEIIRVGCIDNVNFLEIQESGLAYGYGAEYLREIGKYTGWKYEYVQGTWQECMEWLRRGEIDLLLPAQYTEERARDFIFSKKQCCMDYAVLVTHIDNEDYFYNDNAAYDGMLVGMIEGNYLNDAFERYAEERGFTFSAKYYESSKALDEALASMEVDAVVKGNCSDYSGQKLLAVVGDYPAYFIMAKGNEDKMEVLDQAMARIELDHPYYEAYIYDRYYGSANRQATGFTREEMEYIQQAEPITVAFASDREPAEYFDHDEGVYAGIYVDILDMISIMTGLKFVPAEGDGDAMEKLANGEAVMVCSAVETAVLHRYCDVEVTDSYYQTMLSLISYDDAVLNISGERKVAVASSLPGAKEKIREKYPNWQMIEYDSVDKCLKALNKGEVSAVILRSVDLQAGLYQGVNSQELVVLPNVVQLPISFAVSGNESPLLMSVLNKAIGKLDEYQVQEKEIVAIAKEASKASLKNVMRAYPVFSAAFLTILMSLMVILVLLIWTNRMTRKWNDRLQKVNEVKSSFLSKISHEIRTPLNGISGAIRIMGSGRGEEQEKYLDIARSCVDQMTNVIDDLLYMSQMEVGQVEIRESVITYGKLEQRIYHGIWTMMEEKGFAVSKPVIAAKHKGLRVDVVRLTQIVTNLVSNSVKYTPEGKKIDLRISAEELDEKRDLLHIEVQDQGIGMSRETLEKIYEPYWQQEKSGNILGMGLGLPITRELVELMNGSIRIESELGVGTRAVVEIPVEWVDDCGEDAEKNADEIREESEFVGRRALLVEDNEINSKVAAEQLQELGLMVESVDGGKKALEQFANSEEGYYDVIFMDIMMPDMDGYDTARAIRKLDRADAGKVLIVAMTALVFEEDARKTLESGMDYHFIKPIETEDIREVLKKVWSEK